MSTNLRKIAIRMSKYAIYALIGCHSLLLAFATESEAQRKYLSDITVQLNESSNNVQLLDLISELESKTKFQFAYSKSQLRNINVPLTKSNWNMGELLAEISVQGRLSIKRINEVIAFYPVGETVKLPQVSDDIGKQVAISGVVTDESGEPLPGATVVEKGTSNGTITDIEGMFSLNVENGATLLISFVGYVSVEVMVDNKTDINVKMEPDMESLEEVVVVGFSSQKVSNLTGSVGVVDTEKLENRPVSNVSQMLQGVVPGLNITQGSGGSLESNPSINIRGIGTIGAGSTASPLILIDGMEGDINTLNPQDVESISVLKDAAASSIYGARAAFGVILIKTKRGRPGKVVVSYNNNFRLNSPINMPDMVDSYRFALYFNDANINSGSSPFFSDERIQRIIDYQKGEIDYTIIPSEDVENRWQSTYNAGNANVDWYEAVFKDRTYSHEHTVSVTGGNDAVNFYTSANYLDQSGLLGISDDNLKRFTATSKVSYDVNDWSNISYTNRFIREEIDQPNYLYDYFYYDLARQGWPVLPLKDPNGYYFSTSSPFLDLIQGGRKTRQNDWLYQQFQLSLEPVKNWVTNIQVNYRTRNYFNHQHQLNTYNHGINGDPYVVKTVNGVTEYAYRNNFFNTNIYSQYDFSIQDSHNIRVMAGVQSELNKYRDFMAGRQGLISQDQPVLNLTSGNDYNGDPVIPSVSGQYQQWATAGFFSRLNYNFDDRYLLELNIRYDGTSRYREDKRWNFFPSASLGWDLANESFFNLNKVSMLKIRASVGELGNQNTNNWYPTYSTVPINSNAGTWLVGGARPTVSSAPSLISSTLTWEKVRTYNFGLDTRALNGRVFLTFDFFTRYTYDMVGPAGELPSTLGANVPSTNNTDLKTSGFELSINWDDVINDKLNYNLRLLFSDAKTKIIKYPNDAGTLSTYRQGQMLGEIWGYETIGVAKSEEQMSSHLASLSEGGQSALGASWGAGDIMYRDINGDGKINAGSNTIDDPGDQKIIGNSTPRFNLSLDANINWRNFDLRAFFQGVMKRDYFNDSYYYFGMGRGIWWATAFEEHMDYYRADPNHPLGQNLDSFYPRPLADGGLKNQENQTRFLQDASYIRLKNLQLGYSLQSTLVKKLGITKCRFYLSGENLFTLTKMTDIFDPETIDARGDGAVVYPLFKVYSAGLNINF